MSGLFETLRGKPELVIFLTLALGYLLGKLKLGSFSLGSVTGTLLAGLLIGQIGIEISGQVKSIFFTMFLFAVGYSVGPQFVRGVARDGAPQAIFAVVISVLCLICVWLAAKIAGYDVGFAAGLLAGSQTISASIGLATDAINRLRHRKPQGRAEQHPGSLCRYLHLGNHRDRAHPLRPRPQDPENRSRGGVQAIRGRDVSGSARWRYGLRLAAVPDPRLPGRSRASRESARLSAKSRI